MLPALLVRPMDPFDRHYYGDGVARRASNGLSGMDLISLFVQWNGMTELPSRYLSASSMWVDVLVPMAFLSPCGHAVVLLFWVFTCIISVYSAHVSRCFNDASVPSDRRLRSQRGDLGA
jgi:hypothetical protein